MYPREMLSKQNVMPVYGAAFLVVALACSNNDPPPGTKIRMGTNAFEVCRRLIAMDVAKNCHGAEGRDFDWARFDVVAQPGYEGLVRQFKEAKDYDSAASERDLVRKGVDDYPNTELLAPDDRIVVSWSGKGADEAPDEKRWSACLEKQSVAVCAKTQAKFYGSMKALYDAASKAVAPNYATTPSSSATSSAALPR